MLNRIFLSMIIVLIVAGCSAGDSPSGDNESDNQAATQSTITIDDLPAGLGRGYPTANLIEGQEGALTKGEIAPDFQFQLADGGTIKLSELQGKPVLINFWATWCGPCRLEMPHIVEHAENDPELVVLAINTQEELKQVEPFTEEFNMGMPVLLDTSGEIRDLYQVRGMPTTIFIDRDGNVAQQWSGLLTDEMLTELLDEIL